MNCERYYDTHNEVEIVATAIRLTNDGCDAILDIASAFNHKLTLDEVVQKALTEYAKVVKPEDLKDTDKYCKDHWDRAVIVKV